MAAKKPVEAEIGDYVLLTWVDHCQYDDVPLAHESFRLIVFRTFGRLGHVDSEKVHLITTLQESEDSAKNTVLIIGRGMVTGVDVYRDSAKAMLTD